MSTPRPTTLHLLLLALTLLAHLALATPITSPSTKEKPNSNLNRRAPDLSCLTLPTNPTASTPLPAVPAHLKLKHIALGVGTQNYTCATPGSSAATPSSAGALASLYDIGPFLASPLGRMFENALPPLALAMYGALSSPSSPSDHAAAWRSLVAQMPRQRQAAGGGDLLADVAFGEHFFAEVEASLTPTWDLLPNANMYPDEPRSVVWQGKKEASADAPRDACKGLQGEGAVPWLYLSKAVRNASAAEGGDDSGDGIEAVYRVVTAGGMQPDTCEGVEGPEVEVKYAAEYWFYGS